MQICLWRALGIMLLSTCTVTVLYFFQILSKTERLVDLAGPTKPESKSPQNDVIVTKRRKNNHVAPLKMYNNVSKKCSQFCKIKFIFFLFCFRIVDSLSECAQCNDSTTCIASIDVTNDLVASLEKLCDGNSIDDDVIVLLHKLNSPPVPGMDNIQYSFLLYSNTFRNYS